MQLRKHIGLHGLWVWSGISLLQGTLLVLSGPRTRTCPQEAGQGAGRPPGHTSWRTRPLWCKRVSSRVPVTPQGRHSMRPGAAAGALRPPACSWPRKRGHLCAEHRPPGPWVTTWSRAGLLPICTQFEEADIVYPASVFPEHPRHGGPSCALTHPASQHFSGEGEGWGHAENRHTARQDIQPSGEGNETPAGAGGLRRAWLLGVSGRLQGHGRSAKSSFCPVSCACGHTVATITLCPLLQTHAHLFCSVEITCFSVQCPMFFQFEQNVANSFSIS